MKRVINYNDDKIFDNWNGVKKRLDKKNSRRSFSEGDVWWCGVGKNIGIEIYGKNEGFSRPMLIYKKYGKSGFLGICMTSKKHSGIWYVECKIKDKISTANLGQIRTTSVNRLYRKIGRLSKSDMKLVRRRFKELYAPSRLQTMILKLKKYLGLL